MRVHFLFVATHIFGTEVVIGAHPSTNILFCMYFSVASLMAPLRGKSLFLEYCTPYLLADCAEMYTIYLFGHFKWMKIYKGTGNKQSFSLSTWRNRMISIIEKDCRKYIIPRLANSYIF